MGRSSLRSSRAGLDHTYELMLPCGLDLADTVRAEVGTTYAYRRASSRHTAIPLKLWCLPLS